MLTITIPVVKVLHENMVTIAGRTQLTKQEHRVMSLVLESKTNKEIACALGVSERTAKYHVSQLLRKYGVTNRMELLGRAIAERPVQSRGIIKIA
jgi:DNA-binding CsgD family transcriptional regulator